MSKLIPNQANRPSYKAGDGITAKLAQNVSDSFPIYDKIDNLEIRCLFFGKMTAILSITK